MGSGKHSHTSDSLHHPLGTHGAWTHSSPLSTSLSLPPVTPVHCLSAGPMCAPLAPSLLLGSCVPLPGCTAHRSLPTLPNCNAALMLITHPPTLPSSPLVDGEALDPTLLKKNRKDDGETDAPADGEDGDTWLLRKEFPNPIHSPTTEERKDDGETDSDDDEDLPVLIDHNHPDWCSPHDSDNSDNESESAPQATTDLAIDPEMPELVDLPPESPPQPATCPQRRRQRAPRIGIIPKRRTKRPPLAADMLPDNGHKIDGPIEADASPGLQQQDEEDTSDPPNLWFMNPPTTAAVMTAMMTVTPHPSTTRPSPTQALTSLPGNGE